MVYNNVIGLKYYFIELMYYQHNALTWLKKSQKYKFFEINSPQ